MNILFGAGQSPCWGRNVPMLGKESPHVGAGKSPCWGRAVPMLGQGRPHVGAGPSPCWGRAVPMLGQESPLIVAEIIRKWAPFVAVLPHAAGLCNKLAGRPHVGGRATPCWGQGRPHVGGRADPMFGQGRSHVGAGPDALGPPNRLGYWTSLGTPLRFSPLSYPSNKAYADRFGAVGGYAATHTFHPGAARRSHRPCIVASHTYLCLVFCPAGFLTGIWTRRHVITDHCLAKNAESLPFFLQSSWAESTSAKYRRGWGDWSTWCGTYSGAIMYTADPFYVALYFNDIAISARKLGYLQTAHSGIRWGHWNAGFASPTDHPFVKVALVARQTPHESEGAFHPPYV